MQASQQLGRAPTQAVPCFVAVHFSGPDFVLHVVSMPSAPPPADDEIARKNPN
jgi:hypothetical protein